MPKHDFKTPFTDASVPKASYEEKPNLGTHPMAEIDSSDVGGKVTPKDLPDGKSLQLD